VKTLVHTLVTSCIDYCNSVSFSVPKKVMDKLQLVWSQGPGNMSVVCLGWWMMTCISCSFFSKCSTSLLWQ